MTERVWIEESVVWAVHEAQLAEHGGSAGVRDAGLLASALARPLNLAAYGEPDVAALAAAYGYGIARNHPFIDGNKRTAFVAAFTFLRLNGIAIRPDPAKGVRMMEEIAAGQVDEAGFAAWLRSLHSG